MKAFEAWALPPGVEVRGSKILHLEPGGATLRFPVWEPSWIEEACALLKRNRKEALEERPAEEVAAALGAVGSRFLADDDPLRTAALSLLPTASGMSEEMAREVVDGMARDWTREKLDELLRLELGDPGVLDGFRLDPRMHGRRGVESAASAKESGSRPDREEGSMLRALGPPLSVHVCASTVPGVSVTSMIRALLVKSAVVLKPGRFDVVLPVLFACGLREADPELAACVFVSYWPGGERRIEDVLLEKADTVVVYGRDRVVRDIRRRAPVHARFVGYRHRVGAALIGRGGLSRDRAGATAGAVGRAVATFDQRGCVSPHMVFVERGGEVEPGDWACLLAASLDELEEELPSGPLAPAEASEIQQIRATVEMRAAAGEPVLVRHGGRAPWTVVVEPDAGFEPSCTNRVVRIRPVADLELALDELAPVGRYLQTVSLEGVGDRRVPLAESLARIGSVRITSAVRSPWPPPWWHHDGAGPLRSLLRWVDLEGWEEDAQSSG